MVGARRQIHQMLRAEDTEQAVRDMGDIWGMTLDELKIAEYTLLVAPVSAGVTNYLEGVRAGRHLPPTRLGPEQMAVVAGFGVTSETLRALEGDAHRPYLDAIAECRNKRGASVHLYPLEKLIAEAAQSAVDTTSQAACANAVALRKVGAHGNDREAFMDCVSRSTELVLKRPLMHLNWHMAVSRSTSDFMEGALRFSESEEYNLRYDGVKDEVVLEKPLEQWQGTLQAADEIFGKPISDWEIGNVELPDVRIGCPVTFEPKLVVAFYQHMIDLIDGYSTIDISGQTPHRRSLEIKGSRSWIEGGREV